MTPAVTPTDISKHYTPDELRSVIAQAETLIGSEVDDLVRRYRLGTSSATPPVRRHRLIELLLRLRVAADNPANEMAQSNATVAIAEVGGILEIFEAWREDPTWREFQQAVQDPRNYLHAVTTLSAASALKEHHQQTELVPSGQPGGSPDIHMVVADNQVLAVEVKTSKLLNQPAAAMEIPEAVSLIEHLIKRARSREGQIRKDQTGMIVIGGSHIDHATFGALNAAALQVLTRGRPRPHLLAIMISHTFFGLPSVRRRRIYVGLQHATHITTNSRYRGNLRFVGEWAGVWRFEKLAA